MGITSVIDQTVKAIHSGEQRKKAAAEKFAPLKTRKFVSNGFDLAEEFLAYKVPRWVPQGLVAGVDSGFVAKRLASVDLVLIRAVGVVFDYADGKISSAKYFPDFFHFPEPHLSSGSLEEDEAEQSKSLMRLREEVNTAKKIIAEHSPKYLFIDGSIVPQFQDKPRKESGLTKNYSDIVHEFQSLYALAEEKGCTLISTVEDSRGSRFRQILQEGILPYENVMPSEDLEGFFDSSLLDYFLALGERSCAFTYTKNIKQHPVLQDFDAKWGEHIYGLYIKPSLFDRPLRVEFICKDPANLRKTADEVSSVAFALSCMHREYAYPTVLIEADMHAKLRNDEIEIISNKILDKLGSSIKLKMRRDNRPF
ncbi:MAG TPA: DNA double-strand break repair nuclease NurA [archaeon]|nr:DNA double-strand break repair nuclease NurA [archaeon]